jgi:glycosyltransferase involved in cell wall biosynthesis
MVQPIMRILYFSLGYATHDYRFLKAISDAGHEVYFVQLEGNQRQVESRNVPENVNQVIWKGGQKPFQWKDLISLTLDFRRLTREIQPDLIHAGPIQTCGLVAVLSGFHPTLTMSWGFDLMEDVNKNKFMPLITSYVLRNTDYFTSDANVTRDKAVAYGMNPEKTIVFPWGVDLEHFSQKKENKNKEGFVLFCNRSWEERYGVDVLAKAFVQVTQKRDDVRLILLGGGSQGTKLRQIFQRGGVEEFVTFGGQISQNDLPSWYHQADLYISPSHVDGSSVSLMEALACGLPCLVSDIPANKEWVVENENGWLFKDGDVNHLAEKILIAMSQREKLYQMGQAGRRSVEKRADWKKNAEALTDVYREIHLAGAR